MYNKHPHTQRCVHSQGMLGSCGNLSYKTSSSSEKVKSSVNASFSEIISYIQRQLARRRRGGGNLNLLSLFHPTTSSLLLTQHLHLCPPLFIIIRKFPPLHQCLSCQKFKLNNALGPALAASRLWMLPELQPEPTFHRR